MKLIYISSCYSGLVIESQVYKLLDYYQTTGWFSDIVLLQQYKSEADKLNAINALQKHSFKYYFFQATVLYPIAFEISRAHLAKVLLPLLDMDDYVIHTRSTMLSLMATQILKANDKPIRVLNEFRGAFREEFVTFNRSISGRIKNFIRIPYGIFRRKQLFRNHNVLHTGVSPKMRELVINEGVNPNLIDVHPNIASRIFVFNPSARERIRKEYGIESNQRVIILSSGEGGSWQKDQDSIDTLLSKGFIVMNMSKKKIEKKNVINLFVPHNQMPDYLSAGDAALLWRDDIVLNNVACPSKFGEFAVMGLYLIHNKSVDIATRFIADNNCGQLVNSYTDIDIDKIDISNTKERERRADCGYNVFSVEPISKSYYEDYQRILKIK